MIVIDCFFNEYYFLSNFYPSIIDYDGMEYPTVEHAYQAAKTDDPTQREMIKSLVRPGDAKKAGKIVSLRQGWSRIKVDIMYDLVHQKFQRYPDLRAKLLATHPYKLIEGNTWHDNFWGNCTCHRCVKIEGQNRLGFLLMNVRELISFIE